MKRILLVLIIATFITACSSANSLPAPTEPAVNFPTISPSSLPLCKSDDLKSSSNSNEGSGAVVIGLTLTNIKKHQCVLLNPPQATLLDTNRSKIKLQLDEKALLTQVNPNPAMIVIGPTESVIVTIIWKNYCKTQPVNIVRLEIDKDKFVEVEYKSLSLPSCLAKDEPSTISVIPYSYPP
ncbi:MAG: DUF4232 domain-containing protein [Chloroflexota bacterium]